MQARVRVIRGKVKQKEIVLELPAIVGRSQDAGLTINHPAVSRQHAELYEAGGVVRIRDLGSTNGTRVRGKKVAEAVLRPHDQFSIGPLTFEVIYQCAGKAAEAEENVVDKTASIMDVEERPARAQRAPVSEGSHDRSGPAAQAASPSPGPPITPPAEEILGLAPTEDADAAGPVTDPAQKRSGPTGWTAATESEPDLDELLDDFLGGLPGSALDDFLRGLE